MEQYNLWDLERVHIKVNEILLQELNNKINTKFKNKGSGYNSIFNNNEISEATFKNILKPSYMRDYFVPLRIYIKIIESLGISKEVLQKNIISYKTGGGINYVEKPILPINITPVFDMVLAHNIGDGTVINPGKGRLPYFGYRQFDKFYRIQYIRKIENIFGQLKFKEDYFEESTRPYCPPVLSSLFFKYYNLNPKDFLSDKARIPQIVFSKGKKSILAVLLAFIIDEGNVDSTQITINLKNKLLIQDLNKICEVLGYKTTITETLKEIEYARLHILRDGMKELYKDYQILNEEYPIINLGWKGEKVEQSFKIYNREKYKSKGNKEIIFSILKKEQLSVNQLADRINMTRQGVRFHVHNLINERKIKIIDNSKLNWIYGV